MFFCTVREPKTRGGIKSNPNTDQISAHEEALRRQAFKFIFPPTKISASRQEKCDWKKSISGLAIPTERVLRYLFSAPIRLKVARIKGIDTRECCFPLENFAYFLRHFTTIWTVVLEAEHIFNKTVRKGSTLRNIKRFKKRNAWLNHQVEKPLVNNHEFSHNGSSTRLAPYGRRKAK